MLDAEVTYHGDLVIDMSLSNSISARLRDFSFRGQLRVVLSSVFMDKSEEDYTDKPLPGCLHVFFIKTPDISFDLLGAGKVKFLQYYQPLECTIFFKDSRGEKEAVFDDK